MKKFKAFQLLLTLSLAGVLTSCNSEIINLPSDKDDPIVDVSNDSSNQVNTNDKETVYDNIEGSIDRNQEQLNKILTDLADSKYLKDEFAITQEEIDEKVHEKFMDVANESTYNDTYSRFQEYNYALSLVQQGYQIKTSDGKTDLASLQQASNLVLVTPESEYEDVFKLDYSDYVTRNLVPEIKRQYLTARYLYENSYSSIGTTAARNITFVKIQDRDDKPGEASKLVSHFVSLLKDPSVSSEDADLRNLSKLWKGNYTSEETIQGKTYDKILKEWNVSNLNDQLNDQLKKIIEVDTDGSLKKDDNGNYVLKDNYHTDKDVLADFTNSNAYPVEKGILLKTQELAKTKNYYEDTYLNSDTIPEISDDLKNTIFDSNYSTNKDSVQAINSYLGSHSDVSDINKAIIDNSYVVVRKNADNEDVLSRYVVAKRSQVQNDISNYDSSSNSYFIIQINTIVSTSRLAVSSSDSEQVKAEKRDLAMEAAYKMAETDSNKNLAITWVLTNNDIDYSDPDFYDYIKANYPDAIDD